jgi:adenylate kinase
VNLILFGPPGAGKGTQAQFIVKKHNYFQLSTGDLLRAEIKKASPLGKEINEIISKGNFVSDDLVNSLLEQSIINLKFRDRIIFDGYPRNLIQAKNLENILNQFHQKIDAIIFLNTSREIIQKRIVGRMTCEKCNMTLNEFYNKEEIELHPCGKEFLVKRHDDNLDIAISRYDTYMEKTKPILDFYSNSDHFHEIDGSLKIEAISLKIDQILKV